MPVGARKDPFRNFRFQLEIDGIVQGGFSEVTIPDSSSDVIEYREGIDPPTPRKLPGMNKYGNVTLKWGITDSNELYNNWRKLVEDGKIAAARKNVTIILLNEEGEIGASWVLIDAWPSKYDAPDLTAKGNDVAVETLEISHEGMKRVK